ncbi:MAG: hypothetical protein ACE5JS_05045 [Nitrospinota bacterium]
MTDMFWDGLGPVAIFLPLLWAALAVLTVLWIALPFAVFGIKRRIDHLIELLENPAASASLRAGAATGRIFTTLRQEVLRVWPGLREESREPGWVSLFVDSGAGRTSLAEVRVRGDIVDLELDLEALAAYCPVLRVPVVLARLETGLPQRPGLRALISQGRGRLVIQVGPEGEGHIPELAALIKEQIVDVLPS